MRQPLGIDVLQRFQLGEELSSSTVVGLWRFVTSHRFDAEGSPLPGEDPSGFLLYTADGHVTEVFQHFNADGSVSHAYHCGSYHVDGATVSHVPLIHSNHDLIGVQIDRAFSLDGDRMILTAGLTVLVWERAESQAQPSFSTVGTDRLVGQA